MILLDTCALLWLVLEPQRISARAQSVIAANGGKLTACALRPVICISAWPA